MLQKGFSYKLTIPLLSPNGPHHFFLCLSYSFFQKQEHRKQKLLWFLKLLFLGKQSSSLVIRHANRGCCRNLIDIAKATHNFSEEIISAQQIFHGEKSPGSFFWIVKHRCLCSKWTQRVIVMWLHLFATLETTLQFSTAPSALLESLGLTTQLIILGTDLIFNLSCRNVL